MQTVLFTPMFERHAARAGLGDDEIQEIAATLAADPLAGDLIKGTGGLRKVRFARRGEGKSGGYRTIHYFGGEDLPVFLVDVVDKRARENLSQAERNAIAKQLPLLVEDYRNSVARVAEKS